MTIANGTGSISQAEIGNFERAVERARFTEARRAEEGSEAGMSRARNFCLALSVQMEIGTNLISRSTGCRRSTRLWRAELMHCTTCTRDS